MESVDNWVSVDQIVEDQLNLQVEIAYDRHHQFMCRNGLNSCKRVMDLGTGNGRFLLSLAKDHPNIQFVGVDKRSHLITRGLSSGESNVQWVAGDAFEIHDLPACDGILMRYFLLHVPNARDILTRMKTLMPGAKYWIIDVDLSNFECVPRHPSFDLMIKLVNEFCSQNLIDTQAGQRLGTVLSDLAFKNIQSQADPFSSDNTRIDQLVRFLRNEVKLYSHLLGEASTHQLDKILHFIESDVANRSVNVKYGMIQWYACT